MNSVFLPIICAALIFMLEIYAISKGMNGIALSLAVAAISGLGGFSLKSVLGRNNANRNRSDNGNS